MAFGNQNSSVHMGTQSKSTGGNGGRVGIVLCFGYGATSEQTYGESGRVEESQKHSLLQLGTIVWWMWGDEWQRVQIYPE